MILSHLFGTKVSPDPVHAAIAHVFEPLQEISDSLAQRTVNYVFDGSDQEVLLALAHETDPDLRLLMAVPKVNQVGWGQFSAARSTKMRSVYDHLDEQRVARSRLYANRGVTPAQWGRFGRVFAVLADGAHRESDTVPPWLLALTTDVAVCGTIGARPGGFAIDRNRFPDELQHWTPEFLMQIAATQGITDQEAPVIVLQSLFEERSPQRFFGGNKAYVLPGVSEFFAENYAVIPEDSLNSIAAEGRVKFLERIAADGIAINQASIMVTELALGNAVTVRRAALPVLEQVMPEILAYIVPLMLEDVTGKKAEPVVAALAKTEAGAAVLAQAVDKNPALAPLVERYNERRTKLAEHVDDAAIALPPVEPLPDEVPAEAIVTLRAGLKQRIESEGDSYWIKRYREEALSITEDDIAELMDVAAGRRPGVARIVTVVGRYTVRQFVPSFNAVHLLRLYPDGLTWPRIPGQDIRVVADAFNRAGAPLEQLACAVSRVNSIDPADSWMWLYENPALVQEWLTGELCIPAMTIMKEYPRIPAEFFPQLAIEALGSSKVKRSLAQELLGRTGAAVQLAQEGLTDSKAEMRRSAAEWLQSIGDPAVIPTLEVALHKERREVVRAALLSALESLGAPIDAYLTPEMLAKEAVTGLKAKRPAALAWFNVDELPAVRWANGDAVEPSIVQWWVMLAVKLKDPDGSGLLDRYLSLLCPEDAAELGRFCLQGWFTHDTVPPPEEECRDYADQWGRREWQRHQDWAQRVVTMKDVNPAWVEAAQRQAARPVESIIRSHYEECRSRCVGSAIDAKGLLALTTRMPGGEIVQVLNAYARQWPSRRAQIEALTIALYGNADDAALQKLLAIARRFKQATVQAKANELVEQIAEKNGWTTDQLADRTIPEAGFSADRLLHLDYGPREFLGRVTTTGTIELSTADGKPIKSLPAARQDDDEELVKEAKKQLTASRKELKRVLELQSARLYEAMCTERRWKAGEWKEFLLGHPLMGQWVTRLVWVAFEGDDHQFFRPTEDGSLIDLDDNTVELADDVEVAVGHGVLMPADEAQAWVDHEADYEITPLFDQFGADSLDADLTATELNQWKGYLTDTFSIRNVAIKRGYQREKSDDAWFMAYEKPVNSLGLMVVLHFTGSCLPEENIPAAIETMEIRKRNRPIALGEVPRVLLAECFNDYAAFGALGHYDPDYLRKV